MIYFIDNTNTFYFYPNLVDVIFDCISSRSFRYEILHFKKKLPISYVNCLSGEVLDEYKDYLFVYENLKMMRSK